VGKPFQKSFPPQPLIQNPEKSTLTLPFFGLDGGEKLRDSNPLASFMFPIFPDHLTVKGLKFRICLFVDLTKIMLEYFRHHLIQKSKIFT